MQDEMDSLHENHTYELMEMPELGSFVIWPLYLSPYSGNFVGLEPRGNFSLIQGLHLNRVYLFCICGSDLNFTVYLSHIYIIIVQEKLEPLTFHSLHKLLPNWAKCFYYIWTIIGQNFRGKMFRYVIGTKIWKICHNTRSVDETDFLIEWHDDPLHVDFVKVS